MSAVIQMLRSKGSRRDRDPEIVLGRKIPETWEKDIVSFDFLKHVFKIAVDI